MKTITVKINFVFTNTSGGTMSVFHSGSGATQAGATVEAFKAMANDCFDKNLVMNCTNIQVQSKTIEP